MFARFLYIYESMYITIVDHLKVRRKTVSQMVPILLTTLLNPLTITPIGQYHLDIQWAYYQDQAEALLDPRVSCCQSIKIITLPLGLTMNANDA